MKRTITIKDVVINIIIDYDQGHWIASVPDNGSYGLNVTGIKDIDKEEVFEILKQSAFDTLLHHNIISQKEEEAYTK